MFSGAYSRITMGMIAAQELGPLNLAQYCQIYFYTYSEISPTIFSGAYSHVRMNRIAVQEPNTIHIYSEVL